MHRETSTTTNTSLQIIRETIELLSTVKTEVKEAHFTLKTAQGL
jgi:hypothetical protein